jgi:hypothetical protein
MSRGRKRKFAQEETDEIAREYERRMNLRAAAASISKARTTDPVRKKRERILLRMNTKATRFTRDDESPEHLKLPAYEAKVFAEELESAGEPAPFPKLKAPYRARNKVAKEIARERGIKPRTVVECFNQRSWRNDT